MKTSGFYFYDKGLCNNSYKGMGDSEYPTAVTGMCLYVLALKACICGAPKILVCLFTFQIEILRFTVLTGITLWVPWWI